MPDAQQRLACAVFEQSAKERAFHRILSAKLMTNARKTLANQDKILYTNLVRVCGFALMRQNMVSRDMDQPV